MPNQKIKNKYNAHMERAISLEAQAKLHREHANRYQDKEGFGVKRSRLEKAVFFTAFPTFCNKDPSPPQVSVKTVAGGATALGHQIKSNDHQTKIALIITSEYGRPGGSIRSPDGGINHAKLTETYSQSEEEDIVSNWLLTSVRAGDNMDEQFARLPNDPVPTPKKPEDYGSAWVIDDVWISKKTEIGLDPDRAFKACLVFCGKPTDSSDNFGEEILWAQYAALRCAASHKCDVAIFPYGPCSQSNPFIRSIKSMAHGGMRMPDLSCVNFLSELKRIIICPDHMTNVG